MSVFVLWFMCYIAVGLGAAGAHSGSIDKLPDDSRDVRERAIRLGLQTSEHFVFTADGYMVHASRVHGSGTRIGPPVLLMHGLLLNAAGWLDAGGASLGWLLAAAGRDLWLCTARGSHSSRRHAWLSADTDPLYWRFSGHEIGSQDLPAIIDYILEVTGTNKLDYIGFSQGGGVFFIMCSERPEYCDKVNLMVALAPATRMMHTTSIPFRFVTEFYQYNEENFIKEGIWEALPVGGIFQSSFKKFCELSEVGTKLCQAFIDFLMGPNPGSITGPVLRAATSMFPAGTSVHNMAWFGQLVKSDHYHKFDYGSEKNFVFYGSEKAPIYNFSAVTAPVVVMYGRNDAVVDMKDVKWLIKKLPNVKKVIEIEDPLWNHLDFILSKNIPNYLFPKINETLV